MYDVLIVGSGPAGMTAAIYAARMNLKVCVLEKSAPGGAMVNTSKIENYPGYSSIDGATLSMNMFEQMMGLGIDFVGDDCQEIIKEGDTFKVVTSFGSYESKTVIYATGTRHKKLNVTNEEKFSGYGISWCAVCDGSFYKEKEICVVGGGNSALEEAIYLANIANKVYLIHRRDSFRADPIIVNELKEKANVEFVLNSQIVEFIGDKKLEKVLVRNINTNEERLVEVEGCFEFVGQDPANEPLKNLDVVNEKGYVLVDSQLETKVKGLFAAGDIIDKDVRQIVTAVNDGAIAALGASRYCK